MLQVATVSAFLQQEVMAVKRAFLVLFVLLGATGLAQQPVPEIPFDASTDFLQLPADMNFGEVSGIAVNRPPKLSTRT